MDSLPGCDRSAVFFKKGTDAFAAPEGDKKRYQSLFKNNLFPMLLIDPGDLGIVDANPAAVLFYGYHDGWQFHADRYYGGPTPAAAFAMASRWPGSARSRSICASVDVASKVATPASPRP